VRNLNKCEKKKGEIKMKNTTVKVEKRAKQGETKGVFDDFKKTKIQMAIESAMRQTVKGVDSELAISIAEKIENEVSGLLVVSVETIQDMVEDALLSSTRPDVAKLYIRYRDKQNKARKSDASNYTMITDKFVSKYKHLGNPMGQLGQFVYYRTYSRYLPEELRREDWWETLRRAVEYNTTLVATPREEAEELYDNCYHMRQFLSGRTYWVGNTPVSKMYPMSNFNCAFTVIGLDSFTAFTELFYELMIGSGVGLRILKEDVAKLPKVRTDVEVDHGFYESKKKSQRLDYTSLQFVHNDFVRIIVGDSKEGWMQALRYYFEIMSSNEYRNIKTILVDYDHVRPKGERLKKFGGTASGHESLKTMFTKIDSVIKNAGQLMGLERVALRPIDCMDISNIIGENVVSGGVRRSSEMILIDADDQLCIDAKSNLYQEVDGKWVINSEIAHRQLSNNSIYYKTKPSRERLHWQIEKMRYSGEPAWVNGEAGAKRRPNMNGVNPCGEILLDSKGMCNLTTINVFAYVMNGKLDVVGLKKAQKLSARAGYRMTCVELELPAWNATLQRDKLVGCSLTGWQDMVNATEMSREDEIKLLQELRQVAHEAVEEYAKELGMNVPILTTTVKPEGTLSQLPTVSSGVHYSHSPYFIRRVRISSTDPLVKVCEELGYPVFPEVNQEWDTCQTKVIEFPVKAPQGRTKYDVSAIEQLENYKMFMEHYVDHNCSITIHVREHEWEAVEQWVWDNWDSIIGVSFLSLDESFYKLLPYEAIDEEEYNKRVSEMKPFIPSLISKYEVELDELDVVDSDCANGICPIR
jgi:ribonucleoside-diphosphate reductase alpha chain/ribonucleoside-triphosphate reductase